MRAAVCGIVNCRHKQKLLSRVTPRIVMKILHFLLLATTLNPPTAPLSRRTRTTKPRMKYNHNHSAKNVEGWLKGYNKKIQQNTPLNTGSSASPDANTLPNELSGRTRRESSASEASSASSDDSDNVILEKDNNKRHYWRDPASGVQREIWKEGMCRPSRRSRH